MNLDQSRVDDLARRGRDGIAEILRRRPDLAVPAPGSLVELLARMDRAPSVRRAIDTLSTPLRQLLGAVCSLDSLPLSRLRRHLPADPLPHLRELHALGLVDLAESDDRVVAAEGVVDLDFDPLHLGPHLLEIAAIVAPEFVRAAAQAFGCGPTRSGHDSVFALVEAYADDDRVRRALEGLPEEIAATLREMAAADLPDGPSLVPMQQFAGRPLDAALAAGLERGLFVALTHHPDPSCLMPAEVRIALRGPGYRLRYDVDPPPVAWLPLVRADDDARAAALAFDAAATAVLDDVHRRPLVPVQAGGIGTRELNRLTRATRLPGATVRILLELAAHARLLSPMRTVTVTDGFHRWRATEPAERFALLARAWWDFPGRPGASRDRWGVRRQPLSSRPCAECRLQHIRLLEVLRVDQGISRADAAALATWRQPTVHAGEPAYEASWTEATTLGIIAQGALSPVGVALRDEDDHALRVACAAMLPTSTPTATFGSDLTALAVGPPTVRVSTVLDACAVRESSGGATTWRLSRDSVRQALDDGWAVPDLRAALEEIAGATPLPSAVTVLLDDVDRAFGRAVVHTAMAVVVATDEIAAAELQHDPRLGPLRLTAVTPTVFTSALDASSTLLALRKAGLFPKREGDPLDEFSPQASRRRAELAALAQIDRAVARSEALRPRPPREPAAVAPPPDVVALAQSLLDAPRGGLPWEPRPGRTSAVPPPQMFTGDPAYVEDARPAGPSPHELRAIQRAVDVRGRVEIVYRDVDGSITERVIRPYEFTEDVLDAWCELRSADRGFVVGRILAVRAV